MAFRLPRLKIKIGRAKLTIGAGDLLDPLGALRRNIVREAGRVLERGITIKAEKRKKPRRLARRRVQPHIKGPTEPASPGGRKFPWLWVGIGVAVVIGLVLFFVFKK